MVSHAVFRYSGLPSERIIGTGTLLDSIRLSYYLSSVSGKNVDSFKSYVLGEHGSSQVPIYSMTKFNGKPILEEGIFTQNILNIAEDLTRNAAYQIRETQQGTTYGVSKCAETLFNYLLGEKEHLLTLSMLTNAHYRNLLKLEKDIYISMPVKLKKNTIEVYDKINLTPDELNAYRASARVIAENID